MNHLQGRDDAEPDRYPPKPPLFDDQAHAAQGDRHLEERRGESYFLSEKRGIFRRLARGDHVRDASVNLRPS